MTKKKNRRKKNLPTLVTRHLSFLITVNLFSKFFFIPRFKKSLLILVHFYYLKRIFILKITEITKKIIPA